MGRNTSDFNGYKVTYEGKIYSSMYGTGSNPEVHALNVRHPDHGEVGHFYWHPKSGEIKDVLVMGGHEGKGIATKMYHVANQVSKSEGIPQPKHSSKRTQAGDAWAKSVGGSIPPLKG